MVTGVDGALGRHVQNLVTLDLSKERERARIQLRNMVEANVTETRQDLSLARLYHAILVCLEVVDKELGNFVGQRIHVSTTVETHIKEPLYKNLEAEILSFKLPK